MQIIQLMHLGMHMIAESEFEKYRVIQDKNYQSDFDRLMAETAETKYPN